MPWFQELLYPLTAGQPEPLLDTLSPQQLADPDSSFVEVDGVMLHCKDVGSRSPDAPAVLLLHGFNGSVFSWCAACHPTLEAPWSIVGHVDVIREADAQINVHGAQALWGIRARLCDA